MFKNQGINQLFQGQENINTSNINNASQANFDAFSVGVDPKRKLKKSRDEIDQSVFVINLENVKYAI